MNASPNKDEAAASPVVGVADARVMPLDHLARTSGNSAADPLRNVLPGAGEQRVAVAAFGSSI